MNETQGAALKPPSPALGHILGFSKNLAVLMDTYKWPKRGRAVLIKQRMQVSYQTALTWLNDDVVPKGPRLLQLIENVTGETGAEAREIIGRLLSGPEASCFPTAREMIHDAWEFALEVARRNGLLGDGADLSAIRTSVEMVCNNAERQHTQIVDKFLLTELIVRERSKKI